MQIAIYGIFQGDICLYVGQTANTKRRLRQHKTRMFKGMDVTMRVLHYCSPREANQLERKVTMEYRSKGEAMMCRHFGLVPRTEAQLAASRANGLKLRNAPLKTNRLNLMAKVNQLLFPSASILNPNK